MTTIPPCAGKWALFDSADPHDHAEAKKLCAVCPMVAECRERLALTQAEHAYGRRKSLEYGPRGTWAGEPVGVTKVNVRLHRKRAEERMYSEQELRQAHAAYFGGCRAAATVAKERAYQRAKKRASYARRKAA